MSWIFFSSISADAIAAPANSNESQNYLKRQIPRDNDANYQLPTYIPTHSKSTPRKKIEFGSGADNDALYYAPVDIPKNAPNNRAAKQVIPPRPAPARAAQPQTRQQQVPQRAAQPAAPLRPQPRQPQQPVYVPQYQQPQYQAPPRSIYVPPTQQRQAPAEDYYPLYYY